MKSDRLSRHLLIGFGIALGLYISLYWLIEHRRIADSPWLVAYEVDASGHATLEISQKSLGYGPVQVRWTDAVTNAPLTRTNVEFRQPIPVPRPMPVGQSVFEDLTFLPGTVVLSIASNNIQMLPRALTIGTNEFPWQHTRIIEVQSDGSSRLIE